MHGCLTYSAKGGYGVKKYVLEESFSGQEDNKAEAFLEYPGGKRRIAQKIVSLFPEHHSYLEPFFGSGAVLFQKPRSHIERVNDLDDNVTNLFEWIRRDPERLARELYLIPYARSVYDGAFSGGPENSLEKAINFCIRMNMGHGYQTGAKKPGWKNDVQGRERAYAAQNWSALPDKILFAAERLRGVQIENRPAAEVIKRFRGKNVLIYADPPYPLSTRYKGKTMYRYDMGDCDHEELLGLLLQHKGLVVLSGYECELYNEQLQGWYKVSFPVYTQNSKARSEIIWTNFEPWGQMSILDLYVNQDSGGGPNKEVKK